MDTAFVSAMTGAGLDELLVKIDANMPIDPLLRLRLRMPLADGRSLSVVQGRGRVLHSEMHDGNSNSKLKFRNRLRGNFANLFST